MLYSLSKIYVWGVINMNIYYDNGFKLTFNTCVIRVIIIMRSCIFSILGNLKEENLVKSNQVCARMEIVISDCQPTIAKNVAYCYMDLI
jgi:hypothetical protein